MLMQKRKKQRVQAVQPSYAPAIPPWSVLRSLKQDAVFELAKQHGIDTDGRTRGSVVSELNQKRNLSDGKEA